MPDCRVAAAAAAAACSCARPGIVAVVAAVGVSVRIAPKAPIDAPGNMGSMPRPATACCSALPCRWLFTVALKLKTYLQCSSNGRIDIALWLLRVHACCGVIYFDFTSFHNGVVQLKTSLLRLGGIRHCNKAEALGAALIEYNLDVDDSAIFL